MHFIADLTSDSDSEAEQLPNTPGGAASTAFISESWKDADDYVDTSCEEILDENSFSSVGGWDPFEATNVPNSSPELLPCKKPAGPTDWNYLEAFDTMKQFNTWKSMEPINWHVGTKANYKVDGCYSYTNYKCKTHQSCEAQVCSYI